MFYVVMITHVIYLDPDNISIIGHSLCSTFSRIFPGLMIKYYRHLITFLLSRRYFEYMNALKAHRFNINEGNSETEWLATSTYFV